MAVDSTALTGRIKLIAVNLIIFIALLVLIEGSYRLIKTLRGCLSRTCDFHLLTAIKIDNVTQALPIHPRQTRLDNTLGYVPQESFRDYLDDDTWLRSQVTITADGMRSTNAEIQADARVLAIGDSFTFGDQVSDNETWPACLERKLGLKVDNAGVSAYGAAQSLLRGELLLKKKGYQTIIFSIFPGDGFERDRRAYLWGRAKPAVINTDQGLAWADVPDPYRSGTVLNPSNISGFIWLYNRSVLAAWVMKKVLSMNLTGADLTFDHPAAASRSDIIRFALERFSKLSPSKKVVLLQYNATLGGTSVRREVADLAKSLGLAVVDTRDAFVGLDKQKIWKSHHTAYGNQVVCEFLYEKAFR